MTAAPYCRRKSRKKDFRSLGGATGLPFLSKPFCTAFSYCRSRVSSFEPGAAGGAAGAAGAAGGG
jgi:hypothetical protein